MTDDSADSPPIALVTGANKGIGYEISAGLSALGMMVLLAARDPALGRASAKALRATGGDVRPVTLDVTEPRTVHEAAVHIGERFGRLDVLVNNAGISGTFAGMTPSTADVDAVRQVFETNVFGPIIVTNAMLPLLKASPAPRIVNLSSSVGSLGVMSDPDGPLADRPPLLAYAASKSALNALTVQYAKELKGTGILVNAADPGACATDLTRPSGLPITRTAAQGAAIAIRLATLRTGGPSGGFFSDAGKVPW